MDRYPWLSDVPFLQPIEWSFVLGVISPRLAAEEDPAEVLWGLAHLGERRAELIHAEDRIDHVAFAASLWTWWPFKPEPAERVEADLRIIRGQAFRGTSRGVFAALDGLVPDSTLRLSSLELEDRQTRSVSAFLRL